MNIKRTIIEQVRITGPQAERARAFDYCDRHDYSVKYSGPKTISFGRYNTSRFVIVASRELSKGKGIP